MVRAGAVLAAVSACALLAACGEAIGRPIPASSPSPTAASTPPGAEGIDLTTVAGPTCPVQREGETCTRPISATVLVTRADGSTAATVHTSANGTAHVPLSPATYTLTAQPQPGVGILPRSPAPTTTTVPAGLFVSVQIIFDTGIR